MRRCEAEPEPNPAAMAGAGGPPPKMIRKRTVLVFGKSQVGKSHLCNVLLQRPDNFQEGGLINSCTTRPRAETFLQHDAENNVDYEITVVDSPGMFDTRTAQDNQTLLGHVTNFIKYRLEDVHRIFYVFRVGAVSAEELRCLLLLKYMLSDEAANAGICSLVVTHCDGMGPPRRAAVAADLLESPMKPHMSMFEKATGPQGQRTPEVLTVDFSEASRSVQDDRQALMASILAADQPMHKMEVLRCFTVLQELQERQKWRKAFVDTVPADYKQMVGDRAICPQQ